MKPRYFRCLMGREAHARLTESGVTPESFALLLAASGGPKWLGLVGIDRALMRFLRRRVSDRLPMLGASSGAWRVCAMSADEDGSAYSELVEAYIGQRFEGRPKPHEVSAVCRDYLSKIFTDERLQYATAASPFQANLTTTILRREKPSHREMLTSFLGLPLLNAFDRRLIGRVLERGLFQAGSPPTDSPVSGPPFWDKIPTRKVALDSENFVPALLASGSIPFVLSGESVPGAGPGHHVDGGLIDYHFEVESKHPVVYPHFSSDPVPGWLDQFFPFRRLSRSARSNLCLLIPSDELIAAYPGGEFPCRADFHRYSNDERIKRWHQVVKENGVLERELSLCLESSDLLRCTEPMPLG